MSEYYDELINEAFSEFTAAAAPVVQAAGTGAVRATAAHRRKVRLTTFSVLGALLIALPVAAFAANPRGNNGPPPPVAESGPPSLTPSPSVKPSPSDASNRLIDEIVAANPDVPASAPCPLGEGEFRSRPRDPVDYKPGTDALLREAVETNLDADPAWEIAALAVCAPANTAGETFSSFVVAFDRGIDGKPISLGDVIKAAAEEEIVRVEPRDQGGVVTTVGFDNYDAPADLDLRSQQREFVWDGGGFKQAGGPTSFPSVPKTDLQLTATQLKLGPPEKGKRTGTVTVTVTNNGPLRSGPVQVWVFQGDRLVGVAPDTWVGSYYPIANWPTPHEPIGVGESITATVTVSVEANATPGATMSQVWVVLHTGGADPDFSNNRVVIQE